ncbi:hypothetical protein [Bacillus cecembensis]|uniref:hypothetical protein n=1 Tax=Solibacillus cecembensis TaxID=459347 RepID=UPI0007171C20
MTVKKEQTESEFREELFQEVDQVFEVEHSMKVTKVGGVMLFFSSTSIVFKQPILVHIKYGCWSLFGIENWYLHVPFLLENWQYGEYSK